MRSEIATVGVFGDEAAAAFIVDTGPVSAEVDIDPGKVVGAVLLFRRNPLIF